MHGISWRWQRAKRIHELASLAHQRQAPAPGTLQHFLLERYLLFTGRRGAHVHHSPGVDVEVFALESACCRGSPILTAFVRLSRCRLDLRAPDPLKREGCASRGPHAEVLLPLL